MGFDPGPAPSKMETSMKNFATTRATKQNSGRQDTAHRGTLPTFTLWTICFALSLFCSRGPHGFALSGCGSAWAAGKEGIAVQTLLERDSVSLGEPFMFQIRLDGADVPTGTALPDTSGISDFTVEYLGGQRNNSSSVTIINNKVNKVESFGYVYSYRLTPGKLGKLEIPSIPVPIDSSGSNILHTRPVAIHVTEPESSEDFHFQVKYSKTTFYVGEPVVVTFTWYLGKDVESASFNLPLFQDEAFSFADPKDSQDPGKQYLQIQAGNTRLVAEKGTGVLNGRTFATLSFSKVLFAKRPGNFHTPEATVSCKALLGYARRPQGRNPFDSFFDDDFFNPGKRRLFKSFVSRTAPVTLTVLALPEEGKPPGFFGLVGPFQVEASANPTDVSIGDPITLQLSFSGPAYLDNVEIPPLAGNAELEKDFKIPEEMATGVIQGDAKLFTQTLRPKNADVKAIPPMDFPCFNPESGRYEIVRTKAIPLTVKATRVLTSADVEGKSGEVLFKKNELQNWSKGIAYNYEGPEVLTREVYRISDIASSPLWLAVVLIPFFGFSVLFGAIRIRQRRLADPDRGKAQKARSRFERKVSTLVKENTGDFNGYSRLLSAVRTYLSERLKHEGPALAYADFAEELDAREVDAALLDRLWQLFDTCERETYGGAGLSKHLDELVTEAVDIVRNLDRKIR